ncbi:hypothetical protein [Mammaliicoccus sp. Dog046]|uniref:hypothetical protein n=1 Tax=Mammaliicoccus sp. Dog046 TaxID=3034233 RepID=UPI002B258E04|nr:hypothetical protein [Mammaliicoccus sp. Dog046]WQK84795.1 hypothetical protein P3U32_09170 [Mammaliicoccus sp. Dog046]
MKNSIKPLLLLSPFYLYFFIQAFYVVIYKESPIARVMAVFSLLIFTAMLTLFIQAIYFKKHNNGDEEDK